MKQIPNYFTLLNLLFGCLAIVWVLLPGESIVVLDNMGASQVVLPERIWQGAFFIFGAAVIDFLDGFLARLLKAPSEMGKQLDSLSDVVSFGVAPGVILYQLLRLGYAQEENGLNVSALALLPAFVFTCAVAWRLAKFNISTDQDDSFRGVPSPAAGLVVASFPLILNYSDQQWVRSLFINPWFLYAAIFVLSYLMLSRWTFLAMKFKDYSFANNAVRYILVLLSVMAIAAFYAWEGLSVWLAVPVIFVLYVIFSLLKRNETTKEVVPGDKIIDVR